MGLPLNLPGVLGQVRGRWWGAVAPAPALLGAESSIASTATAPVDRAAEAQFGKRLGTQIRAGLSRLWSAAGSGLRAFVHAVQEARMRQALRQIAEIRSRLAPEGAEHELRNRAHFARYY